MKTYIFTKDYFGFPKGSPITIFSMHNYFYAPEGKEICVIEELLLEGILIEDLKNDN